MELQQKEEIILSKEKQSTHRKEQAELQQGQVPEKRLKYNILIVGR